MSSGSGNGGQPLKNRQGNERPPSPPPPPSPRLETADLPEELKALAMALQLAIRDSRPHPIQDMGKSLSIKVPDSFDGQYTKFRRWRKITSKYLEINVIRVPTNIIKIYKVGALCSKQACNWYEEW